MEAVSIKEKQSRNIEVIDQLHTKLDQLHAMTTMIYGGGFESFDECSNEIKDNYLWAVGDMAKEARDLSRKL
jgi:hypothetical protein